METVKYGENSTTPIVITAYDGYAVDYITINGVEYTTFSSSTDEDGNTIVTLPVLEEVTEDTEVVVSFIKAEKVDIQITKVAEEDYTVVLADTEFSLYYLVGESDDSLIDTENVDENTWQLFGTYTTTDDGILSLEGLPANYEYRLVETKASDGRMVSSGQWKIEITDGDEEDTSIITVDGVSLKITGIGDPLAFVLTDEGNLVLPNREYYAIPENGALGKGTYYKIGICVLIIGFILSKIKIVRVDESEIKK